MNTPPPDELIASVRALPAGDFLLQRLETAPRQLPPLYLVGGAVRDLLRGGAPADLDLLVDGPPGPAAAAIAAGQGTPIRRYDRFETVTVRAGGFVYDLAAARSESYAHPGALPDVCPAGVSDDLLRRDFTVNAIAIALTGERPGSLVAAPRAREDLATGTLRVLHERSFEDDPTRLLRLARYRARLAFTIDPETLDRARAAVDGDAIATVSGARVGNEVRLLAREPDRVAALGELEALGIARAIEPGLRAPDRALTERALALLPGDGPADRLVLAIACLDIPAPRVPALLDRLAFTAEDRDGIAAAASQSQALSIALRQARMPSEIAKAIGTGSPELVALAGALGAPEQAHEWLHTLRHVTLHIDGDDLLAAGVRQGPAIGVGLRAALGAALDGRALDRDEELAEALRAAHASG